MNVGFSFCFIILFMSLSLYNRIIFQVDTSFCQSTDLASSGVWENVSLCNTLTLDGVWNVYLYNIFSFKLFFVFWLAYVTAIWLMPKWWHIFATILVVADVIANVVIWLISWQMLLSMWQKESHFILCWQMLLP